MEKNHQLLEKNHFFERTSMARLEKAALMRAFRLILPVFFACLFVWLLMKLHAYDGYDQMMAVTLSSRKESDTLNYYTQYSLWQVLKTSVSSVLGSGTTRFMFPLWMLPIMTYGYVISVFVSLCIDKLKPLFAMIAIAVGVYFIKNYTYDMFLGGVLIAYFFVRQRKWFEWKWISILGILAGIVALWIGNTILPGSNIKFGYELFYAMGAFCMGVALLIVKPLQKILSLKPMVYLGEISFAIYLLHDPLQITVGTHVFNWIYDCTNRIAYSTLAAFLVSYVTIFAVASLFHNYIEKLCKKISNKLYLVITI